jgi:hypothetical protein
MCASPLSAVTLESAGWPEHRYRKGGLRTDETRLPATPVLEAIHAEIGRLYDDGGLERTILQMAGFGCGPGERKRRDGRPKDPDELLAVRARRALLAVHKNDSDRETIKSARKREIVAGGALTDYGRKLLQPVDRMREEILDALTADAVRLPDLVGALGGEEPAGVFEAAVAELKASGDAQFGETKCTSCYPPHSVQTMSSRLMPGNGGGSLDGRGDNSHARH